MVFTKQERLLQISEGACLAVHIYIQESNAAWFTDALFQELLQAIKPGLQTKLAEHRGGSRAASVFKNSAFQVAYYVDKADPRGQVLLQEPLVKGEAPGDSGIGKQAARHQFSYKTLRTMRCALVLVAEPFDPNNAINLPAALKIELEKV